MPHYLSMLQALDTGFKSALGDKARTHIQWADAVSALQENVDAFHICHSVFMVTVYNHTKVSSCTPCLPLGLERAILTALLRPIQMNPKAYTNVNLLMSSTLVPPPQYCFGCNSLVLAVFP